MVNLDRFKFRWFDKTNKTMHELLNIDVGGKDSLYGIIDDPFNDDELLEVTLSDGILMQCTGLKDKNGKMIYEGDLILRECNHHNENYEQKGVVVWENNRYCFERPGVRYHFTENLSEYKIIGNIHENPELLKNE